MGRMTRNAATHSNNMEGMFLMQLFPENVGLVHGHFRCCAVNRLVKLHLRQMPVGSESMSKGESMGKGESMSESGLRA